jgi:TIR domain
MHSSSFQLILVEGFHASAALSSDDPTPWTFTLPRSIRKYRDVTNIEEYLAVRAKLLRSSLNSYGVSTTYSNLSDQFHGVTTTMVDLGDMQPTPSANLLDTSQQAATLNERQRSVSKPKIFVSHSSKDAVFASKLVEHLKAAGADAWMDVNDLGAGNFQQRISEALDECEWFVLVLTQNALDSQWVRQEVDAANRLKNQGQIHDLIFIRADAVKHTEVPSLWGVYNILDGVTDYAMALIRTLKAVGLLSAA